MMNVLKKSKLTRICIALLFVFTMGKTYSQCPVIEAAMVNACGSTEGNNEYAIFRTTAIATAGSYTLNYYSADPTMGGTVQASLSGSTAGPKTGSGGFTTSNGCVFTEVTSSATSIPANSTVIMVPAAIDNTYDVTTLCSGGNLYILYITAVSPTTWVVNSGLTGNFGNTPGTSYRWIQIVNGSATCTSGIRSYNEGWSSNLDGNGVSWSDAGAATYYNNGCTSITPPLNTVSIAPNIIPTLCIGTAATSVTLSYTTTGSPNTYSLTWNAAALAAGFTNVTNAVLPASSITIPLPAGITTVAGTYTASLVVNNTTSSLSSTPQNITITVMGKPAVAPITGATTVCEGKSISLGDVTTGGVWSSSNNTQAPVNASGVVNAGAYVAPGGPYTITYKVSNTCGDSSQTHNVSVLANPVVLPITGLTNVCVGANITLSDAALGGTWSSADITIATVDPNTGVVTGKGAGATIITYTVSNLCNSASASYIVIVSGTAISPISGLTNVCVGSGITLTDATTGGTWSSNNNSIATVGLTSGVVTGVSKGTVTIFYTVVGSGGGCSGGSQSYTITVNGKPDVAPITASTANMCTGGTSLTVSDATAGGVWSSSNNAIATINTSGVVTSVAPGIVTISYKVSGTCGDSTNTYPVTVNPLPSLVTSADTTICSGTSATLRASSDAGALLKWQNEASNGAQTTVSPAATTTYTVTATSSQGCTRSASVKVTVQAFTISLSANPNPVTQGAQLTLTTTASVNPYQVTSWQPTALFSNQTASSQVITAGPATQYIVTATTSAGCTDSDTLNIVVNADVNDIYIPNYFSPNNDGKNDIFMVRGSTIKSLELRIYNQWGQLIFESADQNTPWDGTYNGKQQPVGVYVYVARITLQNGTILNKKGSINLIR